MKKVIGGISLCMLLLVTGGGCTLGKVEKNPVKNSFPPTATTTPTQSKVVESWYYLDKEYETVDGHLGKEYAYVFRSRLDYDKMTKLDAQVKNNIDKNNIELTSFDVAVDPQNSKIVYFSGYEDDERAKKMINKVYSLNLTTYEVKELFRSQNTVQQRNDGKIIRLIGREGSKLIVMSDGIDNSPGPCYNYWVPESYVSMEYLDLNNLKKGLQKYTIPKEKVTEAKEEVKQCEKDLGDF